MRKISLLPLSVAVAACASDPVRPPPERSAARLWIYATDLSLTSGDTVRMGVTAGDSDVTTYVQFPDYSGNRWPDSLHIRWWITDTSRATVDASGLVSARNPGRTTVWVAVGATVDSGTLTVAADPGDPGVPARAIGGGMLHTCALNTAGLAYC